MNKLQRYLHLTPDFIYAIMNICIMLAVWLIIFYFVIEVTT